MDFWFIVKERFGFLSIFIMIIVMSLLLVFAVTKNRSYMPKSLTVVINAICTVLIVSSIAAVVFLMSFGYNS